MKKDIPFHPVEGIAVVVARIPNPAGYYDWNVYLLNNNPHYIHNVLVTSKGYGILREEKVRTSILRHHIDDVAPQSHALIEPIDPSVFPLANEYWVSYYIGSQIYDKKFIFMPETIIEENLVRVPHTDLEGILHE
jgi:hypothetical protein